MSIGISRVKANESKSIKEAELADQQDMQQATETYSLFMSLLKWGTIVTAVTTIIVVAIIASRAT